MRTQALLLSLLTCATLTGCGCPKDALPAAQQAQLMEAYNQAIKAMEKADWETAAEILQAQVDARAEDAFTTYGPAFGLIHYHLGLCQLQLKQYKAASANFEICYRDYPNTSGTPAVHEPR